jgi:retron-type reverse transcriptase
LLQQAVLQVITARFEYGFSDSSFGFRPNRNVQQAVLKAQGYINEGFQYIVDIDLKTFFDEVDHCYLLQLLYRKTKCRDTLRLIRKWLRSPILIDGKLVKRRKGVPQSLSRPLWREKPAKPLAVQYHVARTGQGA